MWNCVLCFFLFKLKLHWYFTRNGSVNDMASLVGTMAWHTSGAKPLSRANGGIVYWRIKGVTKTRWLNVNKLINVVAFRVVSAIMIVKRGSHFEIDTIFHTCRKLIFSIQLLDFGPEKCPQTSILGMKSTKFFERPICPENVYACNASPAYCGVNQFKVASADALAPAGSRLLADVALTLYILKSFRRK